ncbi:MAG: hypothetical protein AAF492_09500, partial [Verrucomicrobiota bacterium]
MKTARTSLPWFFLMLTVAHAGPVEDQLKSAEEHWGRFEVGPALEAWRKALDLDPGNPTATEALSRLEPGFVAADEFLDLIEDLLDRGFEQEALQALENWRPPFLSRDQEARRHLLRGRMQKDPHQALSSFVMAEKLARSEKLRIHGEAGVALALARIPNRELDARERLRELAKSDHPEVAAEAAWNLLTSKVGSVDDWIANLQRYLDDYPESEFRGNAFEWLATLIAENQGDVADRSVKIKLHKCIHQFKPVHRMVCRPW